MAATLSSREIKLIGETAGFDLVGLAPAEPVETFDRYREWIERGDHGPLEYLRQRARQRRDPRALLSEARSVIVCAQSYLSPHPFAVDAAGGDRPVVSRYAWGRDYHRVMRKRLNTFARAIESRLDGPLRWRACVDTAPILERAFAARAGIGWIGKNTCLIHPTFGSFLFLGELLVDLDLEPDRPLPDRCGTCDRCLAACPTGALAAPYRLDSRLCISCRTIEACGAIPRRVASRMGTRVFGCDTCQDACPWNRRAAARLATTLREFWPRAIFEHADFRDLLFESEAEFIDATAGSPVRRSGWDGWCRNLEAALVNAVEAATGPRRRALAGLLTSLRAAHPQPPEGR